MSIIDKVIGAVTPPESEESRQKARAKAQATSARSPWLAMILQHHEQIEAAFQTVAKAMDAAAKRAAERELAQLLSAHANAEEAVIYPALIHFDHKAHGTAGYTEQAGAKANLGELEYLDPMSQDYRDKLEHLQGAVAHHVYEEESDRFMDLTELPEAEQHRLTKRYQEEFNRYFGEDQIAGEARSNALQSARLSPGTTDPSLR